MKGMNKTAAENVFRFFRMKKDEKRMLVEGFIDRERDDLSEFKRDIEVISLEKVLLKPEVKNEEIEGSHF